MSVERESKWGLRTRVSKSINTKRINLNAASSEMSIGLYNLSESRAKADSEKSPT
jgi:hypothetical protein